MTTTELQPTELRCMCDLQFLCKKLGDFGKERENAWRITRKRLKELEKEMGRTAGCCIGPY